jgi:hypothetical protein
MLGTCFDFDFVFTSEVSVIEASQTVFQKVEANIPLNLYEVDSELSFTGGVLHQEDEIRYDEIDIDNLEVYCTLEKEPGKIGVYLNFNKMNINYKEPWSSLEIDLKINLLEEPQANANCYNTSVSIAVWHPFYYDQVKELFNEQGFINISPLPIGFTPGVFAHKEMTTIHDFEDAIAEVVSDYRLEHNPNR